MQTHYHRRRDRSGMWLSLLLVAAYACFAQIKPLGAVSAIQMITTVAGTGVAGYTGDNGLATAATIRNPYGVAVDSAGNLYIADTVNNVIRRVDKLTGIITTVAGNGTAAFSGDNGAATAATLNTPSGLTFDSTGNLYIADSGNNRVRRVDKLTGSISTFAGNGTAAFGGDNGAATSAKLWNPKSLAFDGTGNLYIADSSNSVIRRVDPSGIISTFAGTSGSFGYGGDGGLATAVGAMLSSPQGVACDTADNLYIADGVISEYRIRRVDKTTQIITTVVGTGVAGYSGDGAAATAARIRMVSGLAFDSTGNLYFVDRDNHAIRRVDPSGIISTVIGTVVAGTGTAGFSGDGGQAASALLNGPQDLAFDPSGNLYILDTGNQRVRRVVAIPNTPPTITTVANQSVGMNGAIAALPLTVGDAATPVTSLTLSAASSNPTLVPVANIRFGGSGASRTVALIPTANLTGTAAITLTVSDGGLSASTSFVLTVVPALPLVSTVAGTGTSGFSGDGGPATAAQLSAGYRIAVDKSGNLYIGDGANARVRRVDKATGNISTVVGNGTSAYSGDGGLATAAQIASPQGLAFDSGGNLYIADTNDCRIRRIDAATGIITTVVGNGTWSFSGDGGPASAATINGPQGIAFDSADNLYIADPGNNRIRRVDAATGIITTVVGLWNAGYSGDGGLATAAQVRSPWSLAFDRADNLYIADAYNYAIRRVDRATGIITTVVGNGTQSYGGDGGLATAATLYLSYDVAVDATGNIYLPDWSMSRIRRIDGATGIITTVVGTVVSGFNGDGDLATTTQLKQPQSVALDASGNLYILEQYGYRVRRVTPTSNAPPTITTVANQSVQINTATAALAVTIGDDIIPATSLTLSAASSNLALVPVTNIAIGGSGASRTVTITPTANLTGTAAITLTVSDGGLSASTSFTLSVVDTMPPLFTSAAPPAGLYGQAYSHSFTASGTPAPSFALTAGSLPPGLTLTAAGLLSGVPTATGSFPITLSAANGIVPDASASYTLVISPVPLTVTADNQSRPFGAPNPGLSFSAIGFVLGDTATNALSGTLATTATADSPAGSYAITQGSLSATNYTLSYSPGTLTISATGTNPCAGSVLRTLLSATTPVIELDGTCRYQFTETTGSNGHLLNLIARSNQTINGNGAVIEGSGGVGLLTIIDSTNVTIRQLTLSGGQAAGASNTLAGRGGGLLLYNSSVTLDGVRLNANRAVMGGGLATIGGTTTVRNSVFAANQASESGAAIFAQGPLSVRYSTFADALPNPGAAIFAWDSLSVEASIIANHAVGLAAAGGASKPASEEDNLFAQVAQRSRTYNPGTQLSLGQRSLSADSAAAQFADMGGSDYRLRAESPALDRTAAPSGLVAVDAYGRARPFGNSLADLGAYEFQEDRSVEARKLVPRWAASGSPFTIELLVTNHGRAPVAGLEIRDTLPAGLSLVGTLTAGGRQAGDTLIWPLASIQPNATVSVSYQASASATTQSNSYEVRRIADGSVAARSPAVDVEISAALVASLHSPSGQIFDPANDGLGFAAWNNRTLTDPPTALMYQLFGSGVCARGTGETATTCVLTAPATRQSMSLLRVISSGRAFGMAALSLRLFRGDRLADGRQLPSDFQPGTPATAALVRDVQVEQLIDLYQAARISAASQASLARASDGTVSDLLRVLQAHGFVGASGTDAYTLHVREPGVGGTTLLPYALIRRDVSMYWLYVYDPEAPGDRTRVVTLDTAANTWDYSGVYRGDATNGSIVLRRVSADVALPRTCAFCVSPQLVANSLAQTSDSMAFLLNGPGAILISDAAGRTLGVDGQGTVTVNTIPGASVDQIDPGPDITLPPVLYVPAGSVYRVVITATAPTTTTGLVLSVTAPGMIAELENLPLSGTGDSLALSVDAAARTIRFSAGAATRSAQKLTLALETPDGTSYSFTTSGSVLPPGTTLGLAFDVTTKQLSLRDDAGQNLRYDLVLMRVEPGGVTQTLQRNNLTSGLGAGATLNLDGWTGQAWPQTSLIPKRMFLACIMR